MITYMRDKREENWRLIKDILEDNEKIDHNWRQL